MEPQGHELIYDDLVENEFSNENDLYEGIECMIPYENGEEEKCASKEKCQYKSFLTNHPKSIPTAPCRVPQPVGKSLLIGNLTWWTTDQDMIEAAVHCGCKDVMDVKFAENRTNGLSKGLALIEVESDESFKCLKEKMPLLLIHGNSPEVIDDTEFSNKLDLCPQKVPELCKEETEQENIEQPPPSVVVTEDKEINHSIRTTSSPPGTVVNESSEARTESKDDKVEEKRMKHKSPPSNRHSRPEKERAERHHRRRSRSRSRSLHRSSRKEKRRSRSRSPKNRRFRKR